MERIDILKEPEIHLRGEQKKVYCLPSNGPVLVKGSAGSGKTLVAIARARYLRNLAQQDMFSRNVRIAFFTYDKSLRDEVSTYLNDPQIYVNNIDSWVAGFLSRCPACSITLVDLLSQYVLPLDDGNIVWTA